MRTYTFFHGNVTEGLQVSKDDQFGDIVFLGEIGRGGRCKKISLDRHNPARIQDGFVKYATPKCVEIQDKKFKFTVLADPVRGSNSIMVRVNASTASNKVRSSGKWVSANGDPNKMTIFKASGARSDGTRYCDDLLRLIPDDSILVMPEGEDCTYQITNVAGRASVQMVDGSGQPINEASVA